MTAPAADPTPAWLVLVILALGVGLLLVASAARREAQVPREHPARVVGCT